jgi:hypothetical protein
MQPTRKFAADLPRRPIRYPHGRGGVTEWTFVLVWSEVSLLNFIHMFIQQQRPIDSLAASGLKNISNGHQCDHNVR